MEILATDLSKVFDSQGRSPIHIERFGERIHRFRCPARIAVLGRALCGFQKQNILAGRIVVSLTGALEQLVRKFRASIGIIFFKQFMNLFFQPQRFQRWNGEANGRIGGIGRCRRLRRLNWLLAGCCDQLHFAQASFHSAYGPNLAFEAIGDFK